MYFLKHGRGQCVTIPSRKKQMQRYWRRVAEVLALLMFVVIFVLILVFTMRFILPFIIGGLVAMLLAPMVRILQKRGLPRLLSVLSIIVSTIVIIVAGTFLGVIGVAREAANLTEFSEIVFQAANTWVTKQLAAGQALYGSLPPQVANQIQGATKSSLNYVEHWIQGFIAFLLKTVTHLPEFLFLTVIAVITAFFVLMNRERMMSRFFSMLPPGWSGKVQIVLSDVTKAFVGTVRVQIFLMLLSAILGILGMWLLHFHYIVILGVLFALFGLVPILGSAILTVPWAIGALVLGDTTVALKIIALQIVVSIIRHLIEPKFLAENVGLDTLSTLFSLYVGMKSMGFIGLFLGPIILIAIKSLFATHIFVDLLPYGKEEWEEDIPVEHSREG